MAKFDELVARVPQEFRNKFDEALSVVRGFSYDQLCENSIERENDDAFFAYVSCFDNNYYVTDMFCNCCNNFVGKFVENEIEARTYVATLNIAGICIFGGFCLTCKLDGWEQTRHWDYVNDRPDEGWEGLYE